MAQIRCKSIRWGGCRDVLGAVVTRQVYLGTDEREDQVICHVYVETVLLCSPGGAGCVLR
jgi:hypothetical protein